MAQNPLKQIFDVKREELPMAILMGLYFFLVITSFWILKPIKKSIFIGYYEAQNGFTLLGWHLVAAQAELLAKIEQIAPGVSVTPVGLELPDDLSHAQWIDVGGLLSAMPGLNLQDLGDKAVWGTAK